MLSSISISENKSGKDIERGNERNEIVSDERNAEVPLIQFSCCVCGMREKCRYGNVNVTGRTHSYRYKEQVYYLMDPFRNRAKTDKRRVVDDSDGRERGSNATSNRQGRNPTDTSNRTPNILDFFVIGALCAVCGQSVCLDELCSVFYSKTFCSTCVMREHQHFPTEIVRQIEMARKSRERREAEKNDKVLKPSEVVVVEEEEEDDDGERDS
ncbi:unnamed protein product [Anisakis simplex]|uniref:Cysteine-rich DPF motif domain-containing protein 1 n=1 Tax=Anisakis simplex TaxID=6269 RepID=A0A0M3K136_ANISI|nr:unnamed protein product [Anisakis simplex]